MHGSYQFHRWIITLGAQVRALSRSKSHGDVEWLTREVEKYEAELQQIYIYAEQQNMNLLECYHPFAEIESYLLLLHMDLFPGLWLSSAFDTTED